MVLTLALFLFSCASNDQVTAGAGLGDVALIETTPGETLDASGAHNVKSGDFDGDGLTDLVVARCGPLTASVYWGSGPGLSGTPTVFAIRFVDGQCGSVGVLDANGDDYDDLALAVTDGVAVYSGSADGLGDEPSANLADAAIAYGFAVDGVGDLDGDGDDELAVTDLFANAGAGRLDLHWGTPDGLSETPSLVIDGPGGEFARTVVNVGDVNDDGYPDIVAGSGSAYLYYGGATGLDVASPTTVPGADGYGGGGSVAALGDVNGDGHPDFAVGGPNGPTGTSDSAVQVYFGGSGPLVLSPMTLTSPSASPFQFGLWVDAVGDLDQDGYNEMVVGTGESASHLYWGSAAGPTEVTTLTSGVGQGTSAASLDLNQDGYLDVVTGNQSSIEVYYGYEDEDEDGSILGGDGTNQDCDDNDDTVMGPAPWFADADGDGFGDPNVTQEACEAPEGYVADSTDCDDNAQDVFPGAEELCNGVDDDCEGGIDEGLTVATWYADADEDGYGDPLTSIEACEAPAYHVSDATDCDDNAVAVFPGADELCNGIDDDCEGGIDEGLTLATWYADTDEDGFGDALVTQAACVAPPGYVGDDTDCADDDDDVFPGAEEVCNGIDDDCEGGTDEGVTLTFYADADEDGYGDLLVPAEACEAPEGFVGDSADCDDDAFLVHPGAAEQCNLADDDCDEQTDEDVVFQDWYPDLDGDNHGAEGDPVSACVAPADHVPGPPTDCDDTDDEIHPGVDELCNGVDDDCDDSTDEDAIDPATFYEDGDEDGYGDEGTTDTVQACAAPEGYADNDDDCDDNDDEIFPGAVETCNEEDDDCDGQVDDNPPEGDPFYRDNDDDNYGNPNDVRRSCDFAPDGYVADNSDCDDGRSSVYPGAPETCNNRDDDCDGTNDNDPTDPATFYVDTDGDGFGNPEDTVQACKKPIATVAGGTDCDDADPQTYPGAEDVPGDGVDQDCDGVDEGGGGDDKDEPKGCGCESGGSGSSAGWLFALALLGLRRRR